MDSDHYSEIETGQQLLFKQKECAEILGINPATLYRKIKAGHVEVVDTPIGRRITRQEIRRVSGGEPKHARPLSDEAAALFGKGLAAT